MRYATIWSKLNVISIPNFKNFLSLHIFAQGLDKQKHALKISEHTFIIMCIHKTGYNWYSKMSKRTYTEQHPGKFGYPWPNLTWGPSWFHLLTLWLGVRPFSPGKWLILWSHKWRNPAFWKSVDNYIYVYFTVILYLGHL